MVFTSTDVLAPPFPLAASLASLLEYGVRHYVCLCGRIVYDAQLGQAADHVTCGGGMSYQRVVLVVKKCRLQPLNGWLFKHIL